MAKERTADRSERTYKKVTELQVFAAKALGPEASLARSERKHYGRMVVDLKVKGRQVASGPIEWMEQFLQGVKYGITRKTETKIVSGNGNGNGNSNDSPAPATS
jgi:hypothetical protein